MSIGLLVLSAALLGYDDCILIAVLGLRSLTAFSDRSWLLVQAVRVYPTLYFNPDGLNCRLWQCGASTFSILLLEVILQLIGNRFWRVLSQIEWELNI